MSSSSPFTEIDRLVARTRGQLRGVLILETLASAILFSGAILLVSSLVFGHHETSALWRRLSLSLALIFPLLIAWKQLWVRLRSEGNSERLAWRWEKQVPELGEGLVACVQFSREWPQVRTGSATLVKALATQVTDLLTQHGATQVVETARLKKLGRGLLILVGCYALSLAVTPLKIQQGFAILFKGEQGVTQIHEGPLVGDLTISINYPEYMQRKTRVLPNSEGDLEVPRGSRLDIQATTLEKAQSAWLIVNDEEIPMQVREQRDVTGALNIEGPSIWRFSLLNTEGRRIEENFERQIKIEEDKPPSVTLITPEKDIELEALERVPVTFEARDDFGLSKASIHVALVVDSDNPVAVDQGGVAGKQFSGADDVDLSVVDAQGGDRIAITVQVLDNNGVRGPQSATSVTRYITIKSTTADHYALSDRLRELVETLLEVLANRLELDWAQPGPQLVVGLAEIRGQTYQATDAMTAIIDAMKDDPLTPDEVRLALLGRLGTLESAIQKEKRFADRTTNGLKSRSNVVVTSMKRKNEHVITPLEQTIILIEAMVARLALEDMTAITNELREARQRLRDLVSAYKDNPSDTLKARIMRDIQRLRERMKELQARMAQLRKKLPEEFLNLDGIKNDEVNKGLEETASSLDDLEKMLEDGRIDDALKALDEMESALDELENSLNEDMEDLHEETNPELQRAISELMDRARDLAKSQEKVSEKTDAAAKAREEAQKKALEEKQKKKLKALEEQIAELRNIVESLAHEKMNLRAERELNALHEQVSNLARGAEEMRLLEALDSAENALDRLEMMARLYRPIPDKTAYGKLVNDGKKQNKKVIRTIAELLEKTRKEMDLAVPPEQLKDLQKQQQELSQATKDLSQRIQKQGEEVPSLQGKPRQQVESALDAMRGANRELRSGKPERARPEQQRAQSQLKALMDGLKQAAKPQGAQRNRNGRRRHSQEKVKIPGANEHDAPEAFRKELMDAMKEKAPERYREQVKRYYEALVK